MAAVRENHAVFLYTCFSFKEKEKRVLFSKKEKQVQKKAYKTAQYTQ